MWVYYVWVFACDGFIMCGCVNMLDLLTMVVIMCGFLNMWFCVCDILLSVVVYLMVLLCVDACMRWFFMCGCDHVWVS